MVHQAWFVLPPSMEYYYKSKNYQYKQLPPFRPDCLQPLQQKPMELIYPRDGAKIYVPLEADGSRGRMICTVAHRGAGTKIFWHLDGTYMGETEDHHQFALNPLPGKHKLTLVDADGSRLQIFFEVLDKNR
jgi:penicillin-binding protein 1C